MPLLNVYSMVMRRYLVSYGVSFVVIVLACALVEVLNRRVFWVIPSALLVLGAWGASKIEFVSAKNTQPLSVSLIQGNIPQDLKWLTEYQLKTLGIYADLTKTEWGRDLIVWPESSIPMFQTDIEPFLDAMMHKPKKPIPLGSPVFHTGIFQALKRQVDHCTTTALWPMVLKPKDSIKSNV